MMAQAKYYGPVKKTLVFVAYASSEESGETQYHQNLCKSYLKDGV